MCQSWEKKTLIATFLKWNIKKTLPPITGSVWCSLSFFWTAESLRQMYREKRRTISSVFCLLNPKFIQVALNPELHKAFRTIPQLAADTGGQRESKMSFKFINIWRKHRTINPFISTHAAAEWWEATGLRTSPAPSRCCHKNSGVWPKPCWKHLLLQKPLKAPYRPGSLTSPYLWRTQFTKQSKDPFKNTLLRILLTLLLTLLCFQRTGCILGMAVCVL